MRELEWTVCLLVEMIGACIYMVWCDKTPSAGHVPCTYSFHHPAGVIIIVYDVIITSHAKLQHYKSFQKLLTPPCIKQTEPNMTIYSQPVPLLSVILQADDVILENYYDD